MSGNQKNLTATGESINWNALSQPISMNGVTATYDALGRMVETGSGGSYQQFVFTPDGNPYAIYNASTSTLIKGTVPLPAGDTAIYTGTALSYFRHTDWLGSSRLATTLGHAVYSKTAYAPFGETYNEAGTADRSFTGQDQDVVSGSGGTGAYDFLFRKQDPSAGRWLSPDPYGWGAVDPTNPQSLNRYAYVGNMPLTTVDPTGLDWVCSWIQDEGGYSQICYDTENTVIVTPSGPDENPEQNPGICYLFGECLQFPGGSPQIPNQVVLAPSNPNPPLQICTGVGRGLSGNMGLSGKAGGIPGQTVEPGTAAVIPQQFGMASGVGLAPYAPFISGRIGAAKFSGVTDVMGGKSPIPGVNVRTALQQLFPGQLLLEIPGAADQGSNAPVDMTVPLPMGCPAGTNPAINSDPIVSSPGSPVPAVVRSVRRW